MKSTRDLIAAIRKACPAGTDPDDWLAKQLDLVKFIKNELAAYHHAIKKADDDHEKRIADIRKWIATTQKKCGHWATIHHGDPAGGSFSWTECDICGKDLGK